MSAMMRRVLVVDGDHDFANGIVDDLTSRGYLVEGASSVRDARGSMASFCADVVLLDIRLENGNGLDLLAQIMAEDPETLCIVMTAVSSEEAAVEAMQKGACDYLKKPLDMNRLVATVERCFDAVSLRRERNKAVAALRETNSELTQINISDRKRIDRVLRVQRSLGLELNSCGCLDDVWRVCVKAAIECSEMDCGGVFVVEESSGDLRLAYQVGLPETFLRHEAPYKADSAITKRVMKGRAIYDFPEEDSAPLSRSGREDGLSAIAILPIRYEDRVIACLQVASHEFEEIHDFSKSALEAISNVVGYAVARESMKEALRESEERYHYLADAAIEAIFVNHKGRCLEANQTAVEMFGYDDPAELVGIFGTDVIAPESHEIVKAHMMTNSQEPYEAMGLRKDGSTFPIAVHGKSMPYKDLGEVRVTSIRDNTDYKETQRRFQIIAEASADIIYEWDVRTDEMLWLGDIDKKLGYGPGEIPRTVGGWIGVIHPDDLERLGDAVEHHRRSIEPINFRYRVATKDGRWRHWDDRGYAVLGSDGLPKKWIGACSDVTDQIAMEAQLRQGQKMEAVGRLAGGVAHDFNNLLTGITLYTEMIQSCLEPSDPMHTDLEEIRKTAERASGLTSQLLAFSRKQIIDPKVIQPNDILESSQRMLRRIIGEDIDFVFKPAHVLWRIKADPGQLDQILVNLAVNARDAMPDGGKLTIETQNVKLDEAFCRSHAGAAPGNCVMVVVSDSGHGMDAETLEHIYEPFFSTKTKDQGTGLGLSTVYGIMKQNNGFINVSSESGAGTTFKIYFPAVLEEAQDSVQGEQVTQCTGTETILLVEDEDIVRNLAKNILEDHGYTVVEMSNGAQAFEYCEESDLEIDLLLTDVIMPGMNGRQLHDRICEKRPELLALFMSGYTEDVIAHHGVLDEGTQFIQKPFTIAALVQKVRKVLDR